MKTSILLIALFAVVLTACEQESNEAKIKRKITENIYSLNADERLASQTNAKQYFEKEFPQYDADKNIVRTRGFFDSCRPSDSNANGLVSCFGKIPNMGGGFSDKKMYCGYRPELVGCSDEDTVK